METIKEAALSLLKKGSISQEQYDSMEKTELFGIKKDTFLKIAAAKPELKAAGTFAGALWKIIKPLAGAAFVGSVAKETMIDPIMDAKKIKSSFDTMQKKVPQLQGKDKKQIKDYFDVVKTYSPKAAANPLVAGALVNKMVEFGGVDHKLVQDLAEIESGIARPSIVRTGIEAAAKGFSSPGKMD